MLSIPKQRKKQRYLREFDLTREEECDVNNAFSTRQRYLTPTSWALKKEDSNFMAFHFVDLMVEYGSNVARLHLSLDCQVQTHQPDSMWCFVFGTIRMWQHYNVNDDIRCLLLVLLQQLKEGHRTNQILPLMTILSWYARMPRTTSG